MEKKKFVIEVKSKVRQKIVTETRKIRKRLREQEFHI